MGTINYKKLSNQHNSGFTIVELLIVIVVIAVLAAITIVAFNGVQDRARKSAASSSSTQSAKKIKVWQVDNEGLSPDCPKFYELVTGTTVGAPPNPVSPAICTFSYKDTSYQYTPSTTVAGGYCVTTTVVNQSYKVSEATPATSGGCSGHGQGGVAAVTNLAMNPSFENNITGWTPRLSAVISRTTTESHSGSAAAMVVTPGSVADEGINMAAASSGSVSSGKTGTHIGSAWVKAPSGAALRLFIEEYDSVNTYVSGTTASFTGTGAWQRVSVSRNVSVITSKVVVNVRTNAVLATTFYVDDVMANDGSTLYNYADGSSANWAWTNPSAPHNSSSTGPAL